jgi:hypothetical protein
LAASAYRNLFGIGQSDSTMIAYYAIKIVEALCIFSCVFGGVAVLCMFAEEWARMRDGGDKP